MIIKGFGKKAERTIRNIVDSSERTKKIMKGKVKVVPLHPRFSKVRAGVVDAWERNGKKDITLRLSRRVLLHPRRDEIIHHEIEHVRQQKRESLKSMRKPQSEHKSRLKEMWANTLAEEEVARKKRWII